MIYLSHPKIVHKLNLRGAVNCKFIRGLNRLHVLHNKNKCIFNAFYLEHKDLIFNVFCILLQLHNLKGSKRTNPFSRENFLMQIFVYF